MAGYQVQTQKFFVSLDGAATAENQLAYLKQGFSFPSPLQVSGAQTLNAQSIVLNNFVYVSGAGGITLTLPTADDLVTAIESYLTSQNGSQIYNIPGLLRAYYNSVQQGFSFQLSVYNNTAGAVTIAGNTNVTLNAATVAAAGDIAVFKITVTDIDPAYKIRVACMTL